MAQFIDFAFREEYERVRILGDKLSEIDSLINWEAFRTIVKDMYQYFEKLEEKGWAVKKGKGRSSHRDHGRREEYFCS